jgi:hypothetical protein
MSALNPPRRVLEAHDGGAEAIGERWDGVFMFPAQEGGKQRRASTATAYGVVRSFLVALALDDHPA